MTTDPTPLDELQRRFVAALADPALAAELFGDHAGGADAYANNRLFNRADALAEAYPVVRQLVGEAFFGGLARAYARITPSRSGDLNRYGEGLAGFIAGFPPARELPYLADAARLDWLCHMAYYADDAAPFDLAALAAVPAERQGGLALRLAPAAGLLRSAWPIASLWQAHQPEGGDFPSPDQGGEAALAWRDGRNRVRVRRLPAAESAFLAAAAEGLPLAEALERALDEDMEFDFGASLQRWIADQVIVDFTEP
ncbi:HvfC/BufC N-terminal domain-containing protein [Chitinimonas koreensis]|uniref:HvfC/BufC N-terminal domain-containing protein n=1 Tax=Chitinimonas koreensis TaxID=356302 RepID=UPI00041A6F10|nr:DNA-binding domain-containing protein [Chitinimonas koreensis]